ncbi:sulfatase [Nitzschia inconspicua]|uniref:Sulfatase n=1 Tax=Nitzschia inconspicua TaxID=303405 RepID=A0A9K3PBF9_9STRA|nr:sulfatase [Nitzschia inconspicua]
MKKHHAIVANNVQTNFVNGTLSVESQYYRHIRRGMGRRSVSSWQPKVPRISWRGARSMDTAAVSWRKKRRNNCSRPRQQHRCISLLRYFLMILLLNIVKVQSSSYRQIGPSSKNNNAQVSEKPTNILLLLTDDQDVMLGTFDYMPHVKALLQEQGVTFQNAFVHTPVCCPSRSSILTGRYLHHGDLAHNNSIAGNCYGDAWREVTEPHHTFAVHAQRAGYSTAFIGKYLNQYHFNESNGDTVPPGWDYWMGLEYNSRYYNYSLVEQYPGLDKPLVKQHRDVYPADYLPLVMKQYTEKLFGENTADQHGKTSTMPPLQEPWLLVVSWPTPHGPFTPEPWAKDLRKDLQAPRTPNYNTTSHHQLQKHWLIRQLRPISFEVSQQMDEYYHNRIEALMTIDQHVLEMVNTLQEREQLENTLILYTSDNGFQFGQQRLSIDKRHLYENDIRVPFVVRGPGILRNRTVNKIVANVDIAPTILEVVIESIKDENASLSKDHLKQALDDMSGLSLWKYAKGQSSGSFAKRRDVLISYHGEGFEPCGLAECPPPFDKLWWMPDAWNNTYHCLRTFWEEDLGAADSSPTTAEDSIYCIFNDDEHFVEYYDLKKNPYQLNNDFESLAPWQVQRYERRLQELLA